MDTLHPLTAPTRATPRRRALPVAVARPVLPMASATAFMMACVMALVMAMAPAPAQARSHHHHGARVHTDSTAGQFDYYLLSMSWSPTYCLTHPENSAECGARGYGLILHGLWPQYEAGGYPEACATDATLDAEALRVGASLYPSESLLRHEWERHGSCSGLSPVDYLHAADRASAVLKLPPALEAPDHEQVMTSGQLLGLLRGANPSLPEGAVRIACTRDRLSEIRVCLTRDLQYRECGRGVGGHCPADHLVITATRPGTR
jgi:ribonuclease T2